MPAGSADIRALAQRLSNASNTGIEKAAADVVRVYAEKVKTLAQTKAPVKNGTLKYSIVVTYVNALKAEIGPSVFYGKYQEFGTGTRGEFPTGMYQIKPKSGKYLTFKVNGQWVRTKVVNHPGIPARPFMRPALQEALGDFSEELAKAGALQITKGPGA